LVSLGAGALPFSLRPPCNALEWHCCFHDRTSAHPQLADARQSRPEQQLPTHRETLGVPQRLAPAPPDSGASEACGTIVGSQLPAAAFPIPKQCRRAPGFSNSPTIALLTPQYVSGASLRCGRRPQPVASRTAPRCSAEVMLQRITGKRWGI